jgi:cell wall-associated NlpC family hydrolase
MSRTDARRTRPFSPLSLLVGLLLTLTLVPLSLLASPGRAHAATGSSDVLATKTSLRTLAQRAASFQDIRLGDRGQRVQFAQRVVDRAVTGHYGRPTRHAVERFQHRRDLKATGVVNFWTWLALNRHWHREVHAFHAKYSRVLDVARAQFGDPYAYGAAGPSAFDCSGYTMYVYQRALGKSLPHNAGAQYYRGHHISRAQARPGDLVFFHSGGYIYHAAIWAGHGYIYHAPHSGTVVHRERLFSNSVWFARFIKRP